MKIENRSRKRSHKLDGIGVGRIRTVPFSSDSTYDSDAYDPVGRIRTVPFSSDSTYDSDAYDPVKTRLSESQAEVLGYSYLRFRQSSFHWIISVGVLRGSGRKWNRSDSAYDSDFRFSLGRKRLRL